MVRRKSLGAVGVCLGLWVLVGLLSGCASGRHWSRSLRLSAIDVHAQPDRPTRPRAEDAEIAADEREDDSEASSTDLDHANREEAPARIRQLARAADLPAASAEELLDERNRRRPKSPRSPSAPDDQWDVLLTGYRDEEETRLTYRFDNGLEPRPSSRFQVPPELPGSDAPALRVPPFDPTQPMDERKKLIEELYSPLPALPATADADELHPAWTLPDLENVAWENHPALMQAQALMEVARGQMIQAGLHPNPTVGWQQDTIANGIQGYKGPYWSQTIVTGGKLKLARCAAAMEYENAKVDYQRMKIEIATRVRGAYYDLMVSRQRRRMLVALTRFTDEIYRAQIELVAGGQAAPYEPLQLRVFALQARNGVIDADNSVIASGRRLGAATGMNDVERFTVLAQDEPHGRLDYQTAKAYLLENHTELQSVRNRIVQSQFLSRLEYIRPRIPDVSYYQTVQHAYEVGPFVNSYNFQVGIPIPIFDRNQGNILATQSSLISNERAHGAAQNNLTGRLAGVLARFDTSRMQAENYRRHILPDQVRTYRGVYSRYREAGPAGNDDINFGDVIIAQQTLGTVVIGYADVLSQMWQAYVDVADVLQVEDLRMLDAWFGLGN